MRRTAPTTAEAVAAPHGLAVQICPDAIEVDTGQWDGLNWDEIQREFPDAYHSFMHTPLAHGYPGGETMRAVLGRSSAAIEKLMSDNLGRSIALVAHNVVIKCYLGHVLGLPSVKARSLSQKNCAINVLRHRRDKMKVITLNAVFHLDEAAEKRG
ncbi:MAG: histidine phosphatase family protein [Planctomycetes bacterium]|nr:histidine phosphatase family protein [Planctomycetota bacterium]